MKVVLKATHEVEFSRIEDGEMFTLNGALYIACAPREFLDATPAENYAFNLNEERFEIIDLHTLVCFIDYDKIRIVVD